MAVFVAWELGGGKWGEGMCTLFYTECIKILATCVHYLTWFYGVVVHRLSPIREVRSDEFMSGSGCFCCPIIIMLIVVLLQKFEHASGREKCLGFWGSIVVARHCGHIY